MNEFNDILSVLVILLGIALLASSRIRQCIKISAAHGLLAGIFPVLSYQENPTISLAVSALSVISIKAVILPLFLLRTLKTTEVKREVEPYISYPLSIIFGILFFFVSILIAREIAVTVNRSSFLSVSASLSAILTGLFIILSRKKAITQIIGYIVFENGIYLLGGATMQHHGVILELGILLDILALIFIMGVAVFHISETFDHIDIDKLSLLDDSIKKEGTSEHA